MFYESGEIYKNVSKVFIRSSPKNYRIMYSSKSIGWQYFSLPMDLNGSYRSAQIVNVELHSIQIKKEIIVVYVRNDMHFSLIFLLFVIF